MAAHGWLACPADGPATRASFAARATARTGPATGAARGVGPAARAPARVSVASGDADLSVASARRNERVIFADGDDGFSPSAATCSTSGKSVAQEPPLDGADFDGVAGAAGGVRAAGVGVWAVVGVGRQQPH